jgi:hypothetical protein
VDNVHSYLTDQNQPEIWANRAEVHGIHDARGYYPICLRWFGQFVNALSGWAIDEPQGGQLFVGPPLVTRLLPLANVKFVLSYFSGSYPSLRMIKQFDFGLMIYETPGRMGPAWLAEAVGLGDATDADSFAQLRNNAIDFTEEAVVIGSLPQADAVRNTETTGSIASFQRPSPNRFEIEIEPGRRNLLVVSETYHPGWRARIDGRPAPVLRANHAFLGIPLPADGRRVEVAFEPFSFRIGVFLSLVAILVLSASIIVVLRRRTAP